MSVAITIPSRLNSQRLPNKALAEINGKPLVLWVYDACKKVKNADQVIIATDHNAIKIIANQSNATVMMTSEAHLSGTDRCAEVAQKISSDYIINVQGDEPFIEPEHLENMISYLENHPQIDILTLFHKLEDKHDILDPSKVKLTKNHKNQILYFSRSVIPFNRPESNPNYFKHVGIYAFKRSILLEVAKLPVSELESAEGLEQLRWLENGYQIHGLEIEDSPLGIDTQEDLDKARAFARNHY